MTDKTASIHFRKTLERQAVPLLLPPATQASRASCTIVSVGHLSCSANRSDWQGGNETGCLVSGDIGGLA